MTYTDVTVADIMTGNVLVAHLGLKFTEVCRIFFELGIHHLPVLDENEALVGIISSNDVLQMISRQMALQHPVEAVSLNKEIPIRELMTPNPISIHASASVEEAAALFKEQHFHSLPVVEDGKVVGIVTSTDLVKCFTDQL